MGTLTVPSDTRNPRAETKLSILVLLTAALLLACLKSRVVLIPVLGVVGILLLTLLLLYPLAVPCLLTFLAYGHASAAFAPGAFSIILILGLFAWAVGKLLSSDPSISGTRVDLALVLYVLALLLSMLFSRNPEAGGPTLFLAAKWLAFYVLAVNTVRDERGVILVSTFLVAGAAISGAVAVWAFSHAKMPFVVGTVFRATGLAGNPNELAVVMITALPIAAYMARVARRNYAKLLFAAAALTLVLANLVSLSRTGLIGMVLVVVLIAVRERHSVWAKTAALVFVVGVPLIIPRGFWLRFAAWGTLGGDYSALVRTGAMHAGFRMIAENPVTGIGLGTFLDRSTQYGDTLSPLVAHNMFLHVTAESGVLGLAAMLFLIVSSLASLGAAERLSGAGSSVFYLARGFRVSYVVYLVCGLFGSIQLNQSFWFMPAASVFLLRAARRSAASAGPLPG
jgi:O-antigen ligase